MPSIRARRTTTIRIDIPVLVWLRPQEATEAAHDENSESVTQRASRDRDDDSQASKEAHCAI